VKLKQKTSKRGYGVAAGSLLPEAAHSKYTFAQFGVRVITQWRIVPLKSLMAECKLVMLSKPPNMSPISKFWSA